jgi:hypothetical protein
VRAAAASAARRGGERSKKEASESLIKSDRPTALPLPGCGGHARLVRLLGVKRPDQHIIDERAQRLLAHQLLPPEWIVRTLPKDCGVDFEIESVDQHVVSGNRVWVQLKGHDSALRQGALN